MRFRILAILSFIFVFGTFLGCNSSPRSSAIKGIARERGEGSISVVLSTELQRFGCHLRLDGTSLASDRTRWIVDRDSDGATLWIEGDYTADLLQEFERQLGKPKSIRRPAAGGHLVFVYGKDQCGAMIVCTIDRQNGAGGLQPPLTSVGIYTRVMGLF